MYVCMNIKTRCSNCEKTMQQHPTAVATKEKDDGRNIFPETGISITHHSPTKICSKNSRTYSNMFLNYNTTILLTICLVSLCLTQQCSAQFASSVPVERNKFDNIKQPPPTHECRNIAIRRNCRSFEQLKNCTHVLGHLYIALMNAYNLQCNATEHIFENLREITDFLLIADVDTLTSIKDMFPNLTVIRGRRLFVNYAIVLSSISDLERVEFKSLVSVQRGHVIVENTPKLCYAEKINWERLTSKRGTNNIFLDDTYQCPKKARCIGCKTDYCWSNEVCQKFATDSVLSPLQDITDCHEQCLGGCYNRTAQGCVVCKSYTDHGTCVKKCPDDKYASSHFMRCFTREECVNNMKLYVHKKDCVDVCPIDYQVDLATGECASCVGNENCTNRCDSENDLDPNVYINDISQAELLRGCQILNGSLVIDIYEFFDQRELNIHFQDLKEITGYLKIYRSPYITSLEFFQSLEKIHGNALEHGLFSFVLYGNKNVTDLWKTKPGFQIINGGMYIHGNDKLCNRHIREFRQKAKHDKSLDSIQKSDQEVFCSPAKLNLYVEVRQHRSLTLYWPKDQTFPEVEIIYKVLARKEQLVDKSELDTEVCQRINWIRELKFAHELKKNSTHYMYIVKNLEPYTRYAILVKTFNGDDDTQEARSEIKYVTTKFDIPAAPKIFLKGKTLDTLSVEFSHDEVDSMSFPVVDYYILEVYDMPDDKKALDTRDYCDEPIMDFKDNSHEDYDVCCSRRYRDKRDKIFLSQLRHEFACSIDHAEYCKVNNKEYSDDDKSEPILRQRFEAWENEYIITSLQHFHLYVLQIQACNHAGCSSYSMLSTRTNYSLAADNIDFSFCQVNNSNEYRISFSEPKQPNGYITSYALHFRNQNSSNNASKDHNGLVCVTRLEHEHNEYLYVKQFNYTFNQAAVRVHSLGHHTFVEWKNVSTCSDGKLNVLYYFLAAIACISLIFFAKWLFHYVPTHCGWRSLRPEPFAGEDRMTLMRGVDVVPFNRLSDLEMIELPERNPPE